MIQPDLVPGTTQAIKTCWTCTNSIPYQKGFCADCWTDLDPTAQDIISLATLVPDDNFAGFINAAVVSYVHSKRVKVLPPRTPKPKKEKLSLTDLTVTL